MPILYHNITCIISTLETQSLYESSIQKSGLALFWMENGFNAGLLLARTFLCLPWRFLSSQDSGAPA